MGLSCCIIAHNEGDRIERCILAARDIVDEIVVVDSGSTDDTIAKAEALGAKVFHHAWDGYGPQKRYAEECAANDWILNLDADEIVTPELAREIKALMQAPAGLLPAYRFRQVTVYPGRERPRLWADFHNYVRLYDRRRVRFRESRVHDTVDTDGYPVGQLKGIALHYSWRTLAHVRDKLEKYTDLQAKELKKPRWYVLARLPVEYPILFFRYYVLRRNFTGGLLGLRIAHDIAAVRSKRLLKILNHRAATTSGRKVGVAEELGYRGRQALVGVKQRFGISTRADKTFFVERLDRALRAPADGDDVGITAPGKGDGAGSQAQASMSALCFARAHGVAYVHRPFASIEHAELPMADWVKAWEEYFNLGAGEQRAESFGGRVVPIDRLHELPDGERVIIAAEHYLHFCNADPDAWERIQPELWKKFWQNKTRPARQPGKLRVVVHMRRGDVSPTNKYAKNFTPNAAFVNTLTRLRSLLAAKGQALSIEIYSQGKPEMFADLTALGAELRLDVPALDTHRALIEADILVMSKGAFSYTAGLLNDGLVLYDPQKYRALQGWVERTPDGAFDETIVARRIDALLAR